MRDLLLVGAGGFARETAQCVHAINEVEPRFRLLGFLDDSPSLRGTLIGGIPVLGPIDDVFAHPDALVVITTGRPDNYVSRMLLRARLGFCDERYATIVHPTSTIGTTCEIGVGSVLLAHADLTADVILGRHVAIMPQVVLPHDVRIDDFATIASGVCVGGACHVAEGAYIGSGACLRERVTIGAWAMVGMGAVVTRDVPAERMWWGVPAADVDRAPLPAAFLPESA